MERWHLRTYYCCHLFPSSCASNGSRDGSGQKNPKTSRRDSVRGSAFLYSVSPPEDSPVPKSYSADAHLISMLSALCFIQCNSRAPWFNLQIHLGPLLRCTLLSATEALKGSVSLSVKQGTVIQPHRILEKLNEIVDRMFLAYSECSVFMVCVLVYLDKGHS